MVKRYKVEWTRTEGKVTEDRHVILETQDEVQAVVRYINTEPKTKFIRVVEIG